MPRFIDITDQRFGRLLVASYAGPTNYGTATWLCRCDCGNTAVVQGVHLRAKSVASCGCIKREMLANGSGHVRHRASPHHNRAREYECWVGIRQRCNNPNTDGYNDYGGRGIIVCERWDTYENFLADMGPRPIGHSIERIDNDGNYEPLNCKWIPLVDQPKNRRKPTTRRKRRWFRKPNP